MVTGDIDQKGGSSVFQVLYGEQAKLFEKEDVPKVKHSKKLTVSMVNDGKQFRTSNLLLWYCWEFQPRGVCYIWNWRSRLLQVL